MTLTDNEERFLCAAKKGDLETIKSLITNGLISLERHEEIRDEDGRTALIWAGRYGCLSIVRFLVEENSVNVDGKDNHGLTSLHWASLYGYVEIMKVLISNGANVNLQNKGGWTPLHGASSWGKLSAVNLLLEMGADPTIQNNENKTALDWARQDDVVNAIERHIQRPQQIKELLRCNDRLPIAIWPNTFSRLNSVNCIHQLLCELPQLFKQAAEKEAETDKLKEITSQPEKAKDAIGKTN